MAAIIEIEDHEENILKILRIRKFFCLDDEIELENNTSTIFNQLVSCQDFMTLNVLYCLRLFGNIIKPNQYIQNYIINNNQVRIRNYLHLLETYLDCLPNKRSRFR